MKERERAREKRRDKILKMIGKKKSPKKETIIIPPFCNTKQHNHTFILHLWVSWL